MSKLQTIDAEKLREQNEPVNKLTSHEFLKHGTAVKLPTVKNEFYEF